MDPNVLKYGDFVILYGFLPMEIHDSLVKVDNEELSAPIHSETGFLSAMGFTDNRVFLQTVPHEHDPLLSASQLNNNKELVFQVWPKLTCESFKQMRKLLREKELIWDTLDEEGRKAFEIAFEKIQSRMVEESKSHQRALEHLLGAPIGYGTEVQFMHLSSRSFLKAEASCSTLDKSAYKFGLSNEFSSRMAFKIQPKYNVRQEGEPIQFKDEILIHNSKLDCYVNFSANECVDIDAELHVPQGLPSISQIFNRCHLNKGSKRLEAHVSQFKDTIWRLHFYGSPREGEQVNVSGGDLVRLKSCENSAYLAADVIMNSKEPEVYGRFYHGEIELEMDSVNTIWEVEIDNMNHRQAFCEIVDDRQEYKGIRLRHLLTRKVLHIGNTLLGNKEVRVPIVTESEIAGNSYPVVVHSFANNPKKELYYNTAYAIGFRTEGKYRFITMHPTKNYVAARLSVEDPMSDGRLSSDRNPINVFKPLRDQELATDKKLFIAESSQPSAEHAFIIQRIEAEKEADIFFVASAYSTIRHFRDLVKSSSSSKQIPKQIFERLISVFNSLTLFLYKNGEQVSKKFEAVIFEGNPIQSRQKLLKDFGLIDILTEIIYYPFHLKFFTLQSIGDFRFKQVLQNCYTLLRHIMNEYRPNELYASQWLELYMSHVLTVDNDDIKAEPMLVELIDNNTRILNTKIDQQIIIKFIKMLRATKSEKFVNLLQALIICDGKAVLKNQTRASRLIFEDEEVRNSLIIKLRNRGNEIEIYADDDQKTGQYKWISLALYYFQNQRNDRSEKIEYFISMIYLFANLCLDRNYVAIDYLQTVYSFELCYKIVSDEGEYKTFWGLKSAFARLMNTLWVDTRPNYKLNLPRHIVSWEDIDPKAHDNEIQNLSTYEFGELMKYLQKFFGQLASEKCTKIFEVERNKFTLLALDLVLKMARFGFYTTMDKIKTLISPMLVLLNGMKDAMTISEYNRFADNFRSASMKARKVKVQAPTGVETTKKSMVLKYQESEETLIVMNCKSKICELIKILLAIDNDMSLRRFLWQYKDKAEIKSISPQRSKSKRFSYSQKSIEMVPQNEAILSGHIQEIKKICESSALKLEDFAPASFIKILFNLLRYEHKELVNNAFDLLCMCFSRQMRLKNVLEQVRIIESEQKINAVRAIEDKIKHLSELAETSENWYSSTYTATSPYEFEKCTQIIKDLTDYLTIQENKRGFKLEKKKDNHVLNGDEDQGLLTEQDEEEELDLERVVGINYESQQILMHLKVYEPLIELLKFEYSDDMKTRTEAQTKLLTEIIKFLAKFTYREPRAQEILTEEKLLFFKLLKKYSDLGVESLIEELFRNNKKLIKNTDNVEKFANDIMKLLRPKGLTTYKNARILKTLNVLMTFRGKPLRQNQISIMTILTLRENSKILFDFLSFSRKQDMEARLKAYDKEVEDDVVIKGGVELPPDLDCIACLMQILSTISGGKNVATESKTQGMVPLEELLFIYEKSKYCWHLKFAVLTLLHSAYLETEREKKDDIELLSQLINLITNDMEYISSRKSKNYEIHFHKGVIQSETMQDILYYKGILTCINEMLVKKIYKNIPDSTLVFSKILDLLFRAHDSNTNDLYTKYMKETLGIFKIHLKDVYNNVRSTIRLSDIPMNFSREMNHLILQESLTMVMKDENTRVQKLKKTILKLGRREEFTKNVEEEFQKMIGALVNIEKPDSNVFSSLLPLNEIVKSLIKAIDIQEDIVSKDLKLMGLRMFRKMIERENKTQILSAADWKSSVDPRYEQRIVEIQNTLCDLGVVEMVSNMISLSKDIDLQYESLLLGIAILFGGNTHVQSQFLQHIQEDFDNSFLLSIKELITNNFENIKKGLDEKNKCHFKKMQILLESEKDSKKGDFITEILEGEDDSELEAIVSHIDHEKGFFEELCFSLLILKRVYRFLQLLCEGNNSELQSNLRCQKSQSGLVNRRTYDFITHTAYNFNALVKQINIDSLDVAVQVLDFMVSATRGPCEDNQKILTKANTINSTMDFMTMFQKRNDYMKRGFFTEAEIKRIDDANTSAMKLLNAIVEGNSNPEIINELSSLNFRFLLERLSVQYVNFVTNVLKCNPETTDADRVTQRLRPELFNQKLLDSFDIYIFLVNLAEYSDMTFSLLENIEKYDQITINTLNFYKKNTARIEVIFKESLLLVYFPLHPACRHLTKLSRDELMKNVKRASPNEKIVGLLEASPHLFDEMNHMVYLEGLVFHVSIRKYNFLRDLSTLISFLINLLFLTTTSYGVSEGQSVRIDDDIGPVSSLAIGLSFNYTQLVTSFFMGVFWVIIYGPNIFRKKWRELTKDKALTKEEELKLSSLLEERPLETLPLKTVLNLLWRKGPYDPIFYKNGRRTFGHPFVWISLLFKNMMILFFDGRFIFQLFYFTVSVVGYLVSEITYCLHLLDVINRFDTLANVIKAVTFNMKQLVLTAFLGLIMIYIYSLLGFIFFDTQYFNSDSNERSCSSMIQCYVTTINYGLRNGGGIGESLSVPSYADDQLITYYSRTLFDVSFFIIINIIFLNIIFGIIIDTFAELRDAKKSVEEDMTNICFICNYDRSTIDKNGNGFDKHIVENHNLWNYLHYIYSINAKDPHERNGIESYIKTMLDTSDISWFPIQRSLEIELPANKKRRENHHYPRL